MTDVHERATVPTFLMRMWTGSLVLPFLLITASLVFAPLFETYPWDVVTTFLLIFGSVHILTLAGHIVVETVRKKLDSINV